ncbi:hypothetical protein SUGI_0446300 [Cryptomeria japonica]|nr:hypothetical protein SUGI_0446300 [Cryptomeria japonica]
MGSRCEEVYVAVGNDPLQSVSTLQWTLQNKPADSLVLLHVQVPIRTIPPMCGKFPGNGLRRSVLDAQEEDEKRKLNDCMVFYLQICSEAKVKAKALIVMRADVRRGIVEMVSELGITKLIMGTSSPGRAKSKKKMKRPGKAGYVLRHATKSCDVSLVCKGKLVAVGDRSVVENEEIGLSVPSQPNIQLDLAATIKTPGNCSDERGFTLNIVGDRRPDERNQSRYDASLDITAATSVVSSDINVAESQKIGADESKKSMEESTATKTLKFLLTEGLEETENARTEVQRETAGCQNAKEAAKESTDKFGDIEAALKDAILGSKVKDEYCKKLSRRLKEVEEEVHAMVDNGRSVATQMAKFSHERHQAIQELHTAEVKLAAMEMENCLILKEKELEIKELQELLHSSSRLETPSSPSTNVEFSECSMEDIIRGFWCIFFILICCVIYHTLSYNKYQVA